jgi:hypothetical protein
VIRLATFNLENLFTRPVAMNQSTDAAGREAIEDHAIANAIVAKDAYSDSDKTELLELTAKYKWHYRDPPRNALVQLQKIRGQLFRNPQNGPVEVVADGRDDWVGWFELLREDVNWMATFNTGRVISEVRPDILICVEVENRSTLERFNQQVLRAQFNFVYSHFMVIDGNDQRGIDLWIFSRFPIAEIRSHVDDPAPNGERLFSRDCPEYDIILPMGERLVILPNHLKSKRNGNNQASKIAEKRKQRAPTQLPSPRSPDRHSFCWEVTSTTRLIARHCPRCLRRASRTLCRIPTIQRIDQARTRQGFRAISSTI